VGDIFHQQIILINIRDFDKIHNPVAAKSYRSHRVDDQRAVNIKINIFEPRIIVSYYAFPVTVALFFEFCAFCAAFHFDQTRAGRVHIEFDATVLHYFNSVFYMDRLRALGSFNPDRIRLLFAKRVRHAVIALVLD